MRCGAVRVHLECRYGAVSVVHGEGHGERGAGSPAGGRGTQEGLRQLSTGCKYTSIPIRWLISPCQKGKDLRRGGEGGGGWGGGGGEIMLLLPPAILEERRIQFVLPCRGRCFIFLPYYICLYLRYIKYLRV